MTRSESYKTKQREAILSYIASLGGAHVTAAQIAGHFEGQPVSIGRTTIYRHLEKLTESGKLRKFITDGVSGACYQFTEHQEDCHSHLHLKCESCGVLQHLECDSLGDLRRHILSDHAFEVNALKTVLYGTCERCASRN